MWLKGQPKQLEPPKIQSEPLNFIPKVCDPSTKGTWIRSSPNFHQVHLFQWTNPLPWIFQLRMVHLLWWALFW